MEIYLEIFGYVGMALILLSMIMTSVKSLRWFNLAGSIISMTYGICTRTWPTAVLNFGMAIINIVQLIRLSNKQKEATG